MRRILLLASLLATACSKELVCPEGEVACSGACVSLLSDADHCGACGNACGELEVCGAGVCGCAPGVASCDGVCTDLARDPDHCGACDVACAGTAAPYCDATGEAAACVASCPGAICAGACVDTETDPYHCGACGRACAPGQSCRAGACSADLHVACFNTTEVLPVTADLAAAGPGRKVPGGPIALAVLGNAVYSANNWPSAGLSVLPFDPAAATFTRPLSASNQDVQHVATSAGVLLVTNADAGTLVVLDPSAAVLDEIPFLNQQSYPNPHGFDVVDGVAYVALFGSGPGNGQRIARVDLSGLATCVAQGGDCGATDGEIDLLGVAGAHDPAALPFPAQVLAAGQKVYVTLQNLTEDCSDFGCFYAKPGGTGRLAVIDRAKGDAVSVVDLGEGCLNPTGLALHERTLWVACGAVFYADVAPGALVPVDVGGATPVVGEPLDVSPLVPGKLAFCGGVGYVGDQGSGDVLRFDPVTRSLEAPVLVCPPGAFFTSVSDVACPR